MLLLIRRITIPYSHDILLHNMCVYRSENTEVLTLFPISELKGPA